MNNNCEYCKREFILDLIYKENGKKFCCKECAEDFKKLEVKFKAFRNK